MTEPSRPKMQALWPQTESDPLESRGAVKCWAAVVRERAILFYDRLDQPSTRLLPTRFHLKQLMDVDLTKPEDVAEFCSSYGWPGGWPENRGGSFHMFAPELVERLERLGEDHTPSSLRAKTSAGQWTLNDAQGRFKCHYEQDLVLKESDADLVRQMTRLGILWGVGLALAPVVEHLALLRDMVRLMLFARGALSAEEVRDQAECHCALPGRSISEHPLEMDGPTMLEAIEQRRHFTSNEQILSCCIRYLDNPRLAEWTFDGLAALVNEGLAEYGQFLVRYSAPGDASRRTHRSVTLHQAVCIALYRDLTAPGLSYRLCANETCNTFFPQGDSGAADRGWRVGKSYCDDTCARKQAQRVYRRRVNQARSLARQGVSMEEIAQQLDRNVATVKKWLG